MNFQDMPPAHAVTASMMPVPVRIETAIQTVVQFVGTIVMEKFEARSLWTAMALLAVAPLQASAPATAVRGDYLSQLLNRHEIPLSMVLLGLAVAFSLGAIHALSPGHGKTIVAAYLVGTRGTVKHAIFLGGMVTFTHTISVFFLGFTTLFLSQYVLPEKIYPVLGVISGLSIVWIGATLLIHRAQHLRGHSHDHAHSHDHDHSHVPEGEVNLGSLLALGASGGLVPCPSALVLLLSSIALGRVGLGLVLLVSFSAGLAVVLMAIGVAVLYAKHLLPDSQKTARHPAFRLIPVLSAAIIVCIGLLMTGVSLGVIRPGRVLGLT
jgi:ABC-type nickel/cobalt efflux system permease component RcnA